ncbi:MAG: hypothetical protein JXA09_04150 [Anaerolineae bacterium]|nr:hypothetical protein [Anaerolineae bacterium]
MSEYQYYEFLAIDRPLALEEQQAVARLSSRVAPHPRRAVFTYNWSSFPASARDVLAKYYDAMLYLANWGSTELMFRFPKELIDLDQVAPYIPPLSEDYVSFATVGAFVVLDIALHEEARDDWIEEEGLLDTLALLRGDLLCGDYRLLYLAWLKMLPYTGVRDTVLEPPVPPGLNELSPALRSFVKLFRVDRRLLAVAAERSGVRHTVPLSWTNEAVSRLSRDECDRYLVQLARGEPHLSVTLAKRLREVMGVLSPEGDVQAPRRSVGELLAEAARRREEARRRRVEAAERQRLRELAALAQREAEAWAEIDALIQRMNGRAYDEAVQRLLKLRELAVHRGDEATYARRVARICAEYSRRSGLLQRLRDAGLYPV